MLISVLAFVVITSVILAGSALFTVSSLSRSYTEANFAGALDVAEAGVNIELQNISTGGVADQKGGTSPPGVQYTFGNGTYRVYCTNRDGSTPWVAPNSLVIISTGTVNGISRTVEVSAKGYGGSTGGAYALFTFGNSTLNGNPTVIGDLGTNADLNFNGHPNVTGTVSFNGAGSGWTGGTPSGYTVVHNANPVSWPTVESIATTAFPAGGLNYIATHNDNATAVPPIVGNTISLNGNASMTLKGKAGGANYYITSLLMNGNASFSFDNTNGPITIWQGPSGGSGSFTLNGGTASIKQSTDPTKPVRFYIATTSTVILNGNDELDAGIYAYNASGGTDVIFNGTPDLYGSVVADNVTMNGNPTIHYQPGYFTSASSAPDYYGFDNTWLEPNGP